MSANRIARKRTAFIFLCAAVLLSGVTQSCSFWNTPIKEYFREYTESAAIVEAVFPESYPQDRSMVTSIPSGKNCMIRLVLRNPQQYSIIPSVHFGALEGKNIASLADVEIYQSELDRNSIWLHLPRTFLTETDTAGGTSSDISPIITLRERTTGRDFQSYSFQLRSNSAPPQAAGAVVCVDASTNRYAVCFNMPSKESVAGIHRDITAITINGTEYPVSPAADGTFTITGSVLSQTAPSNLVPGPSNIVFEKRGQPVYCMTGDPLTADDKRYTIEISDSSGLKSAVTTRTNAVRIAASAFTNSDGVTLADGAALTADVSSGTGTLIVVPPLLSEGESTGDAVIFYEVYRIQPDSTQQLLFSGNSGGGAARISIPQGQYVVRTYARKTLFADSAEQDFRCRVTVNSLFVNPLFTGISTGSRTAPFKTLGDALSVFDTPADVRNRVTLLKDTEASVSITGVNTAVTITQENGAELSASGGKPVLTLAQGTTAILENITVKGGGTGTPAVDTVSGAQLTLSGNTRITDGYVLLGSTPLTLHAFTGSGTAPAVKIQSPSLKMTVIQGYGGAALTQETCSRFPIDGSVVISGRACAVSLDTDPKSSSHGKGILVYKDVDTGIEYLPPPTGVSFTLPKNQYSVYEAIQSSVTFDAAYTGNKTVTEKTITLYSFGTPYVPDPSTGWKEDGKNGRALKIPGWLPDGNYQVLLTAVIDGNAYSAFLTITVD